MHTSKTSMLRRSILWLCVLIATIGLTYRYDKTLFTDGWNAITTSTSKKQLPIYDVKTDKPQVAISFDAAWGNEDTQTILKTLEKYNVKTTFFMTGGWVEKYPDDVKAIFRAGHDLGNHSMHHKHMSTLSYNEIMEETDTVTQKVNELTGVTMTLFRPPYGDYNNQLIDQLRDLNYYVIQWSVDSLDWKNYGVNSITDTVLHHKALKNGAIILMHNGGKYTAKALPKVIEGLQNAGYELVPISQLIYKENYHMEADGSQVKNENEAIEQSTTS